MRNGKHTNRAHHRGQREGLIRFFLLFFGPIWSISIFVTFLGVFGGVWNGLKWSVGPVRSISLLAIHGHQLFAELYQLRRHNVPTLGGSLNHPEPQASSGHYPMGGPIWSHMGAD